MSRFPERGKVRLDVRTAHAIGLADGPPLKEPKIVPEVARIGVYGVFGASSLDGEEAQVLLERTAQPHLSGQLDQPA